MELVGGNFQAVEAIRWTEQIETAQALDRLGALFYKFKDIHWVPFEQALAAAKVQKKPIFAVVLWGALDDQSC
jgi:hypothetical protein